MIRYRARLWMLKANHSEMTTESLPTASWTSAVADVVTRTESHSELVEEVIHTVTITVHKLREK